MTELKLETKSQKDKTPLIGGIALVTPPISEGYWKYRVQVVSNQAIIGFPKFGTHRNRISETKGTGNTNLPYVAAGRLKILNHIWHNRGKENDGKEFRKECLKAIKLIQNAARVQGDTFSH